MSNVTDQINEVLSRENVTHALPVTSIKIAINKCDVDDFERVLSKRPISDISALLISQTGEHAHYSITVKQGHEDELYYLGYRYGFNKVFQ